jgi:nitrogen regulatory protein PII-like uncharacterized protein
VTSPPFTGSAAVPDDVIKVQQAPTAWVNLFVRFAPLGQPDPDALYRIDAIPVEMLIEQNGHNAADTIELKIDNEKFPFDPRIIRGITIEAFLADMGDYQTGYWERQPVNALRDDHGRFAGVIDEVETGFDDEWRWTKLKGRDYTAFFVDAVVLDTDVSYKKDGVNVSLRAILEDIIASRFETENLSLDWPKKLKDIYPAEYKGAAAEGRKGERKTREGESVWEAIQELCFDAGVIAYFDLDKLVVRLPRELFSDTLEPSTFWYMTLGRDILSYSPLREMGRQSGINVRVTSYDTAKKKTLRAHSPKDPADAKKPKISGSEIADDGGKNSEDGEDSHPRPYVVRNVVDQEQLQKIADSIYEQLRHQEMSAILQTDTMYDSKGRSLVRMEYGDPLAINVSESLDSILAFDPLTQMQALIDMEWSPATAHRITNGMSAFRVPFYVHTVRHKWGARDGEGYSCTIELRAQKQVEIEVEVTKTLTFGPG